MAVKMTQALSELIPQLRYEPTAKRIRASSAGTVIVDSSRALLVWEPRRVVPHYAVPREDIHAELAAAGPVRRPEEAAEPADGAPILTPATSFREHTVAGQDLAVGSGDVPAGAAFRIAETGLDGYVLLDFAAFDRWLEEDEAIFAHPRDPFHRVDIRAGDHHVTVDVGGTRVADTKHPTLVFETNFPRRFYLPRDDVRMDLLTGSATVTGCAYKGRASYYSLGSPASGADARSGTDLAFSYEHPIVDAARLEGLLCFDDSKAVVTVDG